VTANFDLIGEELCLDFTNTVDGWRAEPKENLNQYSDLLDWAVQAGAITAEHAEYLSAQAQAQPQAAADMLDLARDVREALFRIFSAISYGDSPADDDLALFNRELARAMAHTRIVQHGEHFDWAWQASGGDLSSVLWEVMHSAANLLTTPERLRWVHECSSETCDWLFIDTTKNHSRRWCDMKTCGNLHKVRKHRQQQN
jgi:predicted RNA-binding Zn ribbon-like protein